MRLYIYKFVYKCFSWVGSRLCFKRNSVEILVEFQMLEYFLKFRVHDRSGWVSVFSNVLEYQMPYKPLIEFLKTETHSRVHSDCHVLTFSSRGVTVKIIIYQKYSSPVDASTITTYGRELRMIPPLLERARLVLNLKRKEKKSE